MTDQVREEFDLFDMDGWTANAAAEKLAQIVRDHPDALIEMEWDRWEDSAPVCIVYWSREKTADEIKAEEREAAESAALREFESLSRDRAAFAKRGIPFPDQGRLNELAVTLKRSPPPEAVRMLLE